MPHPDAQRWDARYARECGLWLENDPRQLLVSHSHLLPDSGLALDAASGVAINGFYLARRGLRVIALDISEVALRMAKRLARKEQLLLEASVCDLAAPWLPPFFFDVILNFHFFERATLPVFRAALKPGGLLFFESFVKIRDLPENPVYYLEPGELPSFFRDYEIIHYQETRLPPGKSHPERGLSQMVARKPR
jgi:SAM-dependent methyltransferase